MRSTLSKFFLLPALAAGAALLSQPAQAEKITVPFAFTALGHSYPAGVYTVDGNLTGSTVTVFSGDGVARFTCIIRPGQPTPGDQRIVLRFIESNGTHVLDSVQYRSEITSQLSKHHDRKVGPQTAGGQ